MNERVWSSGRIPRATEVLTGGGGKLSPSYFSRFCEESNELSDSTKTPTGRSLPFQQALAAINFAVRSFTGATNPHRYSLYRTYVQIRRAITYDVVT